ncbi:Hint domain-containing protein [Lentibacter algarum]|uniref:Hint domain-containing protein n=1 Tax=Lentibacter algarum TaxID=576131 RepID=UPI001C072958|nr:Hint domain-containing protein [Lentibacter algarum]MBU2981565.1 Hint domain-containing protein [Lentibacter algarum]
MPAPYISEIRYLGAASTDFVEVAVDAGTNVSNISIVIYNPNGTVRSTNTLGTLDNTIAGTDVYVIDTATSGTFNGLNANGAVAIVDNGVVTGFFSFNGPVTASAGPASGTTSTVLGTTASGGSFESTDGTNYTATTTPTAGTVPCFLTGTMIETSTGPRPVEGLKIGDIVHTRDNGPQPVLWAGRRELTSFERANSAVRIPVAAFGHMGPSRPLTVSRNHCILLSGPEIELRFGEAEVLAPAKALVGWAGIREVPVSAGLAFHHLLFAQHEVIVSEGLSSESLHLGQMALLGFCPQVRRVLQRQFACQLRMPAARMVLSSAETSYAITEMITQPTAA